MPLTNESLYPSEANVEAEKLPSVGEDRGRSRCGRVCVCVADDDGYAGRVDIMTALEYFGLVCDG